MTDTGFNRVPTGLREFLRLEAAGGVVLMAAALLALIASNSPLKPLYQLLLNMPVEVRVGPLDIAKPLLLWINDGLMAVFFLLVGLEIKREFREGELSSAQQTLLPAIAAVGGIAVPALVYSLCTRGDAQAMQGWAIPAATDIAFAVGAMSLLGILLWVCVLKSGVHATLAGVATALLIPMRSADGGSPVKQLEHVLHPWVVFLVVPLFGFANAGLSFAGVTLAALTSGVTLGVAAGLFVGKQIGVFGTTWLAIRLGLARLPEGANWLGVYGTSLLAGVGFTMSLFIGTLAWESDGYATPLRLGVLIGSLASGVAGFLVLLAATRRGPADPG